MRFPVTRRALGAAFVAGLGLGCGGGATLGAPSAPTTKAVVAAPQAVRGGATYIHAVPEEAYWASHSDTEDGVVSRGTRLVLDPRGRILRAAWELQDQALTGCAELAPQAGKGYLCWTATELFRAEDLTGPLTPVALPAAYVNGTGLRGVRNIREGALVVTDRGPLVVAKGENSAAPLRTPAIADMASLGSSLALALDVFGRIAVAQGDGPFQDVTPAATAARALFVTPTTLAAESVDQRYVVTPDGKLDTPLRFERFGMDPTSLLATYFPTSRAVPKADWPFAMRDVSPLMSALSSGGRLDDKTAQGVIQGLVGRLDLRTGETTDLFADWLPMQLLCEPFRAEDALLITCAWDRFEGYTSYVLRSSGGPPVLEHVFSDDGSFVGDDRGALAFTGHCEPALRDYDPSEDRESFNMDGQIPVGPVVCVRAGPGTWVEREVHLQPEESLVTWVPQKDGRAVAVTRAQVTSRPTLPPPLGAEIRREAGGVLVIGLPETWAEITVARDAARTILPMRQLPRLVDRTFTMHEGETLVGWSAYTRGGAGPRAAFSVGPDGAIRVSPPPSSALAMVSSGDYGLAIDRTGTLWETTTHGLAWVNAGPSPLPPGAFLGSCSALGCVLDNVARLGWGPSDIPVRIEKNRPAADPSQDDERPILSCAFAGDPVLVKAPSWFERDASMTPTLWGDVMSITGLTGMMDDPLGGVNTTKTPANLVIEWRHPFDTLGAIQRATLLFPDAADMSQSPATPLLDPSGQVSVLVPFISSEVLLGPRKAEVFDALDASRSFFGEGPALAPGLVTGAGKALVLSASRRRLAVDTHGKKPVDQPFFVGIESDLLGRRPLALTRRGDDLGLLVADGPAAHTVGVAFYDAKRMSLGPVEPLAPFATLTLATDKACRDDRSGYSTLLSVEPALWLRLSPKTLPGVKLGGAGLLHLVWGQKRVCLKALYAAATSELRPEGAADVRFVAQFPAPKGAPEAVIASDTLRTPLACVIQAPSEPGPKGSP